MREPALASAMNAPSELRHDHVRDGDHLAQQPVLGPGTGSSSSVIAARERGAQSPGEGRRVQAGRVRPWQRRPNPGRCGALPRSTRAGPRRIAITSPVQHERKLTCPPGTDFSTSAPRSPRGVTSSSSRASAHSYRTPRSCLPDTAFVLVNDHDPKPLYYQFAAENPGSVRSARIHLGLR